MLVKPGVPAPRMPAPRAIRWHMCVSRLDNTLTNEAPQFLPTHPQRLAPLRERGRAEGRTVAWSWEGHRGMAGNRAGEAGKSAQNDDGSHCGALATEL